MNRSARHVFPCIDNTTPVAPVKAFRWGYDGTPDGVAIECFASRALQRGDLDRPGLFRFEVTLDETPQEEEWWGDVGWLQTRLGVVNLVALGRGLVLSTSQPMLRRIVATFPRDVTATHSNECLDVAWQGNSFRLQLAADRPGKWLQEGHTWFWNGASPSTRVVASLFTPQNLEIDYPGYDELLRKDLTSVVSHSRKWIENAPHFRWNEADYPVWDHLWIEHRLDTYHPVWKIPRRWEGVGRGYGPVWYGHWDLVQNVLDRVWYDLKHCQGEIDNLVAFFSEDEGRFQCAVRPDTQRVVTTAPPPLEPYAALRVFYRDGDRERLARLFSMFARDFDWWRRARQHDSVGLFWWLHMLETGYDNIGRGQTTVEAKHAEFNEYAAVDLSSMLAMYAEDLGEMARILGDEAAAAEYEAARNGIIDALRRLLWDPGQKFFGDLHVPSGRLETVLTVASFWPLVAGAATDDQAAALVEHIRNPREFWTPFPLSTVAANGPAFDLDCWRGPVWTSQNYWVIRGLQRYGYLNEAAELALLTLEGMQKVWDRDRKIYEFYHPFDFYPDMLTRKGKVDGPVVYYTGHNPLHAVLLEGLWGLEPSAAGCRWEPPDILLRTRAEISFWWGDRRVELQSDGHKTVRCNGQVVTPGDLLPLDAAS